MEQTIKLFEIFAGIGSQHQALKNIAKAQNWKIEPVGIVEWFRDAIIAYQAIHHPLKNPQPQVLACANTHTHTFSNNSKIAISKQAYQNLITKPNIVTHYYNASCQIANNYFDIKQLKHLPDAIDILTYSFPCQDISHQGKQQGFAKNTKTRSALLWQIDRVLKATKDQGLSLPKYLLLENVKAITNQNNYPTLLKWLKQLEKYGYCSQIYHLNAANFNSAQNRQRVFVISVLKTHQSQSGFQFPDLNSIKTKPQALKTILDENDHTNLAERFCKYPLIEKPLTKLNIKKTYLQNYTNFQSEAHVYDINYSGPTLTASGAMSRIKLYNGDPNCPQIRYLNPLEAFRYMGFSDQAYWQVANTNLINPTKMIYLAGNAISVPVLEAIFKSFKF